MVSTSAVPTSGYLPQASILQSWVWMLHTKAMVSWIAGVGDVYKRQQIGKLLVLGRNGCYGTGCIMTCYCDDGNGIQSCYLLYLFGQCADDGRRMGHLADVYKRQAIAVE